MATNRIGVVGPKNLHGALVAQLPDGVEALHFPSGMADLRHFLSTMMNGSSLAEIAVVGLDADRGEVELLEGSLAAGVRPVVLLTESGALTGEGITLPKKSKVTAILGALGVFDPEPEPETAPEPEPVVDREPPPDDEWVEPDDGWEPEPDDGPAPAPRPAPEPEPAAPEPAEDPAPAAAAAGSAPPWTTPEPEPGPEAAPEPAGERLPPWAVVDTPAPEPEPEPDPEPVRVVRSEPVAVEDPPPWTPSPAAAKPKPKPAPEPVAAEPAPEPAPVEPGPVAPASGEAPPWMQTSPAPTERAPAPAPEREVPAATEPAEPVAVPVEPADPAPAPEPDPAPSAATVPPWDTAAAPQPAPEPEPASVESEWEPDDADTPAPAPQPAPAPAAEPAPAPAPDEPVRAAEPAPAPAWGQTQAAPGWGGSRPSEPVSDPAAAPSTWGTSASARPRPTSGIAIPPRYGWRPPQPVNGKVLAVAAAKGGVGKTTVSIWLAQALGAALAANGQRAGLLDLNIGQFDIGPRLGVAGTPDLASLIGTQVDDHALDQALVNVPDTAITALCGPSGEMVRNADVANTIPAAKAALRLMKQRFPWTVIDTPAATLDHPVFNELVLRQADLLLMVVPGDVVAIRDCLAWLGNIEAPTTEGGLGFARNRTAVLLNMGGHHIGVTSSEVQSMLTSSSVSAQLLGEIPRMDEIVRNANAGHWAAPAEAISELAQVLSTLTGVEPATPDVSDPAGPLADPHALNSDDPTANGGVVSRLLSRLRRG